MFNERQLEIIKYLEAKPIAKNSELLNLLGDYSSMTLWRDLKELETAGVITRKRGFSMMNSDAPHNSQANLVLRLDQSIDAKIEIAKIAANLILPSRSYFLDAGSTVLKLVSNIRQGDYTMLTCSANIAIEMTNHSNQPITFIGGEMNSISLSCSGQQTIQSLNNINLDIAVMGTSGYSRNTGFTSCYLSEAQVKSVVIKKAAHTILLMDHEKINRSYPFTFATLDDVDVIVSNAKVPADFCEEVRQHGVLLLSPNDGMTDEERKNAVFARFNN